MLHNSGDVLGGGISHIVTPVVNGKFRVEADHQRVTVGFGQDGGRSDGKVGRIALDHTFIGDSQAVLETVAVNQQEFRLDREAGHRIVHPLYRGIKDIDFIDAFFGDLRHAEGNGIALNDGAESLALGSGQLFGVINLLIHIIIGKHNSRGADRACQAAASRLVAPAFHAGLV